MASPAPKAKVTCSNRVGCGECLRFLSLQGCDHVTTEAYCLATADDQTVVRSGAHGRLVDIGKSHSSSGPGEGSGGRKAHARGGAVTRATLPSKDIMKSAPVRVTAVRHRQRRCENCRTFLRWRGRWCIRASVATSSFDRANPTVQGRRAPSADRHRSNFRLHPRGSVLRTS